MQSGDDIHGLQRILDLTRLISIVLLLLHFYETCFPAFQAWGMSLPFLNTVLSKVIDHVFILQGFYGAKLSSLLLLGVSVLGARGKKSEKLTAKTLAAILTIGLLLYLASMLTLRWEFSAIVEAVVYISSTALGYLLILAAATQLSRLLILSQSKDVFNEINETFPQEERLIQNDNSLNFRAVYRLKGKIRPSFINIPNPFRGLLIAGTPGSGKSYYIIRHIIRQHLQKGFTAFIYDFKFPDLSRIAYNALLEYYDRYPIPPTLYYLNFDDLSRSHRCNLLSPETMFDLTDATESSRTIMLALNREWLKKTGDFFVESPINFTTAIFWFLKRYEDGRYCTLPHSIELAQIEYQKLFLVLSLQPEIEVLINPFITAYVNGALEQLEGQIASAKIGMARLASPQLYYILSGSDFTLDVNNPEHPKVICVGNNPAKHQIYGAVISLCVERMLKLVNQKGKLKSSLIYDEVASLSIPTLPYTIATARGNKCAISIAVQDFSQLRNEYGKDLADVIINVCGNIICGQVLGESAKTVSDRIGQIIQQMESVSINSVETSYNKTLQLATAIQPSRIANLSAGEFVGAVADDPHQPIKLKAFHAQFINDHAAIAQEEKNYQELPVLRQVDEAAVMDNFYRIKQDIKNIIAIEMKKIEEHPALKQRFQQKQATASPSVNR
jgi:hypothetical protein